MAENISEGKVHKSLVMDKELAGAIGVWAAGACVGFSEAVRRLCAQGLAEWPGAAGAVVAEIHQAEGRLSGELARVSAAVAGLESRQAELLALLEEALGGELLEGDGGGADLDSGFDEEEFDREFDEWWEAKKHEWD